MLTGTVGLSAGRTAWVPGTHLAFDKAKGLD
jgi:hypothetical protein